LGGAECIASCGVSASGTVVGCRAGIVRVVAIKGICETEDETRNPDDEHEDLHGQNRPVVVELWSQVGGDNHPKEDDPGERGLRLRLVGISGRRGRGIRTKIKTVTVVK
jgi:hypothetical protein